MILLLTLVYVLQRTLASPIRGVILEDRAASTCTGDNCRSLWSIVWSCIVTIFACTWVAVHPNVPTAEQNARRRWYSSPLRRASIMFYALIGPEFVLIWAWRQRIFAGMRSEMLEDWSRVHGFLAVMGGFVDVNGKALSLKEIERLVGNQEIEYPIVSREEIEDRSKGDAVTKTLVVLQTAWFLLQCVARASQHLALTELELATAAFAVLSIVMYVLWWDKPLDVQLPIRVRRRRGDSGAEEQDRGREDGESTGRLPARERNWQNCLPIAWGAMIEPFFVMMGAGGWSEMYEVTSYLVVGQEEYDTAMQPFPLVWVIGPGTILVTTVFGGIHCVGWSFDFPSHTERLLWRISAISITGVPWGIVVFAILVPLGDTPPVILLVLTLLYGLSRALLVVVSFSTLRSLPASALRTVEWTTFLPHV